MFHNLEMGRKLAHASWVWMVETAGEFSSWGFTRGMVKYQVFEPDFAIRLIFPEGLYTEWRNLRFSKLISPFASLFRRIFTQNGDMAGLLPVLSPLAEPTSFTEAWNGDEPGFPKVSSPLAEPTNLTEAWNGDEPGFPKVSSPLAEPTNLSKDENGEMPSFQGRISPFEVHTNLLALPRL